jgi:anti-sigma B factor antagonist
MKLQLMSIEGDTVFVRVEGEITPGAAGVAQDPMEQLIDPKGYSRKLVLNLQQVDYMDSSGIAWLLGWERRTRQAGGALLLFGLSPRVSEVLRISRMDMILRIYPDEAAVRAALATGKK